MACEICAHSPRRRTISVIGERSGRPSHRAKKASFMEEFESRLAAAYLAWHESRGRTPDRFFSLYAEDIELHSILEASLGDAIQGPFVGKDAAIAYFAAIAEQWEMVEARIDKIVARGETIVCVGHAKWRNLKTLRLVAG